MYLMTRLGYNQVLFEDTTCNRMHESLNLFAEIVKNPIFKNTPIFVFLNKKGMYVLCCTVSYAFPSLSHRDVNI